MNNDESRNPIDELIPDPHEKDETPVSDTTLSAPETGGAQQGGATVPAPEEQDPEENGQEPTPKRKHRISRWIKIPLWIFCSILMLIILIPVLLYVPPVQTAVKNLATDIVRDKTGMDIKIDLFRLKFPLDVHLKGVSIVEATGDTMVNAREAIADVKLLPLLKLDVDINRLELHDGYYRMVSPDSSMIMKIRAGMLRVDDRSGMNLKESHININEAMLSDGDIQLYMNVWRQQQTPPDTTQTPFLIEASRLDIERIRFAMSMLPTIDTLVLNADALNLRDGIINLRTNDIHASLLTLRGGDATYIAPTPEFVAAHPLPVADTTLTTSSPPMTIRGDSISLDGFNALYAIKGANPLPGFDPSYIQVTEVGIGLKDFYNQASSLRLPLRRVKAKERSGLQIVAGHGLVALTEAGISLDSLSVKTLYSDAFVTADLPFALMNLEPEAPVNARLRATLGMPDVVAFMPALSDYTRHFPSGRQLNANIEAEGRLDNVGIRAFDVAMPGVFSIRAEGTARNALDIKQLVADLKLDGEVENPGPFEAFAEGLPFRIPPLRIKGTIGADRETYKARIDLLTDKGDLLADGFVGMTSEHYEADLKVNRLNVAHFMPDLGIGNVTAHLKARGAGFNPTLPSARTDIDLYVNNITYQGKYLHDISIGGVLAGQRYSLDLDSPNEDLNLKGHITGTLAPDRYCAEGMLRIYNADLQAFGMATDTNYGAADLEFDVTASPQRWLYDAAIQCHSVSWHLPDMELDLPEGLDAIFVADPSNVHCTLSARGAEVEFDARKGLQEVTDGFIKAMDIATRQIDERNLDVEELQQLMPPFALRAAIKGNGLLADFLQPSGMSVDTIAINLVNDSLIYGNMLARRFNTGSLTLDTLTFDLRERGKLLDYQFHMGNRPGVLDEFAQADVNGYLGSNRLSAYVQQRNLAGQTGYRVGFTAAFADSTVSLHFTPLRSTIAYMPWVFNDDNHIDYSFNDRRVNANLRASSRESSLLLMTEPAEDGDGDDLHLNISNIKVEDFLRMSIMAPPMQATLDGDVRIHYDGKTLAGKGNIDVTNFIYDKMMVGDFALGLNAGVDLKGESVINAALKINGDPALGISTTLEQTPNGLDPKEIDLELTQFPLKIANAFLGKDVASLSGELNGHLDMTGNLTSPLLNGAIEMDSVSVYLPIMGSAISLRGAPITVENNLLGFHSLDIFGANKNPISLNGAIDATDFSNINLDLTARGSEFQLINNDRRAKSDLYGKLFLDLDASVKGPLKHFDINANLDILSNTDVTYNLNMAPTAMMTDQSSVVRFVNFADSTAVAAVDTVPRMMAMRIHAGLVITPGAEITVNLGGDGKASIAPSGRVNYFQNFMGDMTLNGQIYTGNGTANYKVPLLGDKEFTFNPSSYILFNGNMMNPVLNITAYDNVRANVVNSSGNSSLVNFLVTLMISQTLSSPKVVFDLSTDDDMAVQNELKSMSADQRSTQAMNLLVTGRYSGADIKTSSGNLADNMLYGFLESQLNSWLADNVRGVDLSFGIDNYDKSVDGVSSNTMTYSYQVSKSLFSNRFKIVVGGNYSTDAAADESIAENLISDISFEYTLKQTNNLTMLVRLFRHIGYESVLEGEITEMGAGFTMRRRLSDLRRLFRVRWGKRKNRVNVSGETGGDIPNGNNTPVSGEDSAVLREIREEFKSRTDSVKEKGERLPHPPRPESPVIIKEEATSTIQQTVNGSEK